MTPMKRGLKVISPSPKCRRKAHFATMTPMKRGLKADYRGSVAFSITHSQP